MPTPVEEIKDKLDIVELISSYIPVQPAGKNFKANCPFHKEKTPSFMISPERQTWHCFGACNEGGDIFKFIMKYENLEFYEALKILAEKAHVELKRVSPSDQKQFGVLYDINNSAKDFFVRQLAERNGDLVKKYLAERGLKKETIDEFEIGLAPAGYDNINLHLINLGYPMSDIERAGVVFKSERGTYIDRFRNRVMFPIYNTFGKVVGFSGRILENSKDMDAAKYVNSPETPIFVKSRVLYGLHKSKDAIREKDSALLVEGQMDFLMTYQDGVKNVVATSGTALTGEHLKLLKRLTDNLILSFDNDEAGFTAIERSIDLAASNDFNVKVIISADDSKLKDPAEIAKEKPGTIAVLTEEAQPAMEFYFKRYLGDSSKINTQNLKLDMSGFKKSLRIILGKIKNLASAVEKAHWIKKLSSIADMAEESLIEEMKQLKSVNALRSVRVDELKTNNPLTQQLFSRRDLISERLISLAIAKEDLRNEAKDYVIYFPEDYSRAFNSVLEGSSMSDQRLNDLINTLSLRADYEIETLTNIAKDSHNSADDKILSEFNSLLKELQLLYLREKRETISLEIKEAEKIRNDEKLLKSLREFDNISKLIQNLL